MALFWILFLMGLVLEPTQGDDTKLLLVQTLFRHGARAPILFYPTDPNTVDYWKEGAGKLTQLGKKQQYALGLFFREMYRDFITTNPIEVTVNSSDTDRCMRSALATIAAFYKPSSEWKFDDTVDWQPIPVYLTPDDVSKNTFMNMSSEAQCPQLMIETMKKSIFLRFQHDELMKNLTLLTGRNMNSLLALFTFRDTLEVQRVHGLTIPPWAEYHWEELSLVAQQVFHTFLESKRRMRRRIGPLLEKIVEDLVEKSAGGIPDIKVRLYSFHDYEVAALLKTLKLYNGIRPPFCASVVFELREKMDGEKVVRLLYLNSTTPQVVHQEPHLLVLEGCSEYCPLNYFVGYTKNAMLENWEEECGISNKTLSFSELLDTLLESNTFGAV